MTDREPSKSPRLAGQKTSSRDRDLAVTIALIRGIATVLAAIIVAIVGPLLMRETPPSRETQTSPSPMTSSEEASPSAAQLR